MVKAIIFDLSGVIVFNDLNLILEKFAKELKIDSKKLVDLEEQNHGKLLLGKLSIKEFCSSVRSRFDLELDSLSLMLIWEKIYSEQSKLNTEVIDLIKELKKNYAVGAIANMFDSTAQFHQRQKLFLFFKPSISISCRLGCLKKETNLFADLLSKMRVEGKDCLFIDDNEDNFKIAKEFGMKMIQYKDNKQLFKELKKLKII